MTSENPLDPLNAYAAADDAPLSEGDPTGAPDTVTHRDTQGAARRYRQSRRSRHGRGDAAQGTLTAIGAARVAVSKPCSTAASGTWWSRRVRGPRPWPMRSPRPTPPAAWNSWSGSMSAPPGSLPWALPCPRVRRWLSSPRPGPPSGTSCPPSWRPTTPPCRWWCCPPTGPTNSGAPAPTRPPSSWTSSASTCGSPSTSPPAPTRNAPWRPPSARPPASSKTSRPGPSS